MEFAAVYPDEQEEGLPMRDISTALYCIRDCLQVDLRLLFSAELGIYQADQQLSYQS